MCIVTENPEGCGEATELDAKADIGPSGTNGILEKPDEKKFTMFQAISLNTMNMFGTGPLITIPYCLASVTPYGPQCMVGYAFAVCACIADSFVWGELGSRMPESGGSHTFLRKLFGEHREVGRFMSFMYFWQFLVSGPAEIASGCIAIAEYLVYFSPQTVTYGYRVVISLASLAVMFLGLYQSVQAVGRIAKVLMAVTILAMAFTLIMSWTGWKTENLQTEWPDNPKSIVWAIGVATRFGVYDMTGYYDICFAGGEVQRPRRTIPISVISTCVVVGLLYLVIYVSVIASYDFNNYIYMYTDDYNGVPVGIISLVTEQLLGKGAAYFMTIIVTISIFGSVYAMACGFGFIPYAAAKSGDFFKLFAHESPTKSGLADYSLLLVFLLSTAWCFFSLDIVVDAMVTLLVLMQFMAQSFGLVLYRYRIHKLKQNRPSDAEEDHPDTWKMPAYPLPCIVQFILFGFIFITSDSYLLYGSETPILELAIGYLVVGLVTFKIFDRKRSKSNQSSLPDTAEDVQETPEKPDLNHQETSETEVENS